ncbi:MAG TPA: universal stress protein [Dissulfurispiraceae bacterium]|nr:universal stress protein [Dissulfurispiraceae bacterium]
MMNIKKILLPVDFPDPSLNVIHQAAAFASHFHSEIILLHVVTALSRTALAKEYGTELEGLDILDVMIAEAERKADRSLDAELEGLAIRSIMDKGDAAWSIVQTAQEEKADLIMMPSFGHTFSQFLLGSVTAKVIQGTECPVWTDAHIEKLSVRQLALRHILCAVDFTTYNQRAVSWAVQLASEFGARLTLVHVTPGVELWGPGGNYVNKEFKDEYVDYASRQMAEFKKEMGIKADVLIGSGDVPMVLGQAVRQTDADLLVTGCRPYGLHLRTHGYAIICAVPIPVLSM